MQLYAVRASDVKTLGIYRFSFDETTGMQEVHLCMLLAISAAEGVYGAARVRLEFGYCADDVKRTLVADGRSEVGYDAICMFTALLLREPGLETFRIACVEPAREAELVAAGSRQ
jgi:hypothetical protein